jgi:transcriptional regulator with XRE-family HTH domain
MDDCTKLVRKLKRNPTAILLDDEIAILMREALEMMPELSLLAESTGTFFEDGFRWSSLGARCKQARAERGISIKDAAARLKIPQYRVAAVEEGRLRELVSDLAWKYFDFLGVDPWVKKWIRANRELASRAGLAPNRGGRESNKTPTTTARAVTSRASKHRASPRALTLLAREKRRRPAARS